VSLRTQWPYGAGRGRETCRFPAEEGRRFSTVGKSWVSKFRKGHLEHWRKPACRRAGPRGEILRRQNFELLGDSP